MNEELQDRPQRKELFEFREHFRVFQQQVYEHFKMVAEKDTVNNLEGNVRDLGAQIAEKVGKIEFETELMTQINDLERSIKDYSESNYAPKESTCAMLE